MKLTLKLFSVLICAIIIFPCFTFFNIEAAEDEIYYCREALKSLPNSDKLIYAYDKLSEGIEASLTNIQIYNGHDNISLDEFKIVFDAYRRDHTEHFWLGNTYSYSYNHSTLTSITPEYIMSGSELDEAKLLFDSEVSNILNQLSPSMSEYEKEKKLHDILASKITYIEAENAHNAYGAIVEGKAVCEGYAEALQYLLQRAGIQSLIVLGSSKNPSSGVSEAHAWNMVKIDGKYYHTDLTWNDQGSNLYYAYFNQTDAVITADHIIDETAYSLPVCNSTDANYFYYQGNVLEEFSADTVGQILKDSSLTARFYIPSGKSEFITWLTSNIHSISTKAGITGAYGYSYSGLGNEVIVIIDTCQHNNLTHMDAVKPSCTENGSIEYYLCQCGKYFSDAQGKKEIIDISTITVLAGHKWTKKVEDSKHLRSTPETCSEYYTYFYGCEGCDGVSPDKFYTSDNTIPHSPVYVEGVEPSCSTKGKLPYYRCACGKCFKDAEGTKEIPDIEGYGNLNALSHKELDSLGRCTACGSFVEITDEALILGLTIGAVIIGAPILLAILRKIFRRRRK